MSLSIRLALVAAAVLAAGSAVAQKVPAGFYQDLQWRPIGPPRGGRTRAVAGIPTQPNVFYVGAVNGGVWKTNDAGRTWRPIFDDQPTQSIGALAVAPSDPNVIYVGSGEGLHRPDLSVGDGIYRSGDGGKTWVHLGLTGGQQIPELAIDPRDPNRLYAAVLGHPYGPSSERGVFRSGDGGKTWQRVLYKDDNTGASAVALDPQHPDTVYAGLWEGRLGPSEDKNEYNGTGGGLYKSTDGGATWKALKAGLPENLSQLNLAVAPSRPSRLFAVIATSEPGDYASAAGLGVYRSDDAGEHWERITRDPRPALRIGGGDLPIVRVDPQNPDVVYSASIVTVKSVDGGKTWAGLRGAPGGDDYQNLWINPNDPRVIALVGDQGAVITVNGGESWSSWFNQPTSQLYHIGITPTFPYRVCSGQQESGSVCIATRGNDGMITAREWHPVGVIEYGYVAPDPLDADLIYGAGRNEVTRFHVSTGQVQNVTPIPLRGSEVRVDRTEPLLFSPLDPHTLYYASNVLYQTTDAGANWQAISPDLGRAAPGIPPSVGKLHEPDAERQRGVIYSLAASPLSQETLWAGTDDGLVWVTRDGGKHWTDVTPPDMVPWSKVTQIEASHFDADTAYVSVSRLRIDDLRPFIYRTRDGGRTWQPLAAHLTDIAPVNAVREDPVKRGLLYAATERAVWVSFDDGRNWESLQLNLPHTSMRDLAVRGTDLIVATHGRGFWVLDDASRLRLIGAAKFNDPFVVPPAPTVRARRSTWSDTPIPTDEPTAANPPAGAVIDYYLPRAPKTVVVLEVLDASGVLVRRYASDDPVDPSNEELARQLIPPVWVLQSRPLPHEAGMHRRVWDLHYPAPFSVSHEYPIAAVAHGTPRDPQGPLAPPGRYTVRITVNGRRAEAPLTLVADPRVTLASEAYQAQFQLSAKLAARLDEASRALATARSLHEQLKAVPAASPVAAAAHAYDARIAALLEAPAGAAEGAAPPVLLPAVQGRIGTLYAEINRADAAPTAAQSTASAATATALAPLTERWRGILAELPAVNAQLRAAGLAALNPDQPPAVDLDSANEE